MQASSAKHFEVIYDKKLNLTTDVIRSFKKNVLTLILDTNYIRRLCRFRKRFVGAEGRGGEGGGGDAATPGNGTTNIHTFLERSIDDAQL